MYELSPEIAKYLKIGYMFLPLVLAVLAAVVLMVAAARKSLTGGTALVMGALAGIIVLGSLVLNANNLSAAVEGTAIVIPVSEIQPDQPAPPGAIPQVVFTAATIGYTFLPIFLGLSGIIALLIVTFGKDLNGATALAIGGMVAIVVVGSIFTLQTPEGEPVNPLALAAFGSGEAEEQAEAAPPPVYLTVEAAEAAQAQLTAAMQALAGKLAETREKHAETQGKLEAAMATHGDLESQNAALQAQLGDLRQEIGKLEGKLETIDGLIGKMHEPRPAPAGGAAAPAPAPAPSNP